jgi:hypothetical protein
MSENFDKQSELAVDKLPRVELSKHIKLVGLFLDLYLQIMGGFLQKLRAIVFVGEQTMAKILKLATVELLGWDCSKIIRAHLITSSIFCHFSFHSTSSPLFLYLS